MHHDRTEAAAYRAAYLRVLEGFEAALAVENLPPVERARFVRCRLSVLRKLDEPALRAVPQEER